MAVPTNQTTNRMKTLHILFVVVLIWSSCGLPDAAFALVSPHHLRLISRLHLPANVAGPEALAFDSNGRGPYTGVDDGRILVYRNSHVGFVDFATTSPNRTKKLCDGTNNSSLGPTCGRTLGLEFDHRTGNLYIVDVYKGLLVVGPKGGLATQLVAGVNGKPFGFTNAIDIDPRTGVIYFTDAGAIFGRSRTIFDTIKSGSKDGRLFKYDPRTKKLETLLTGLSGANGVAISRDRRFLVVAEYIAHRLRRYWLKGPKAKTSEIFLKLEGHPDNIKRTRAGDFWVAVEIANMKNQTMVPVGQRISPRGVVLNRINLTSIDPSYKRVMFVSEIQPQGHRLYVGCPVDDFIDTIEIDI